VGFPQYRLAVATWLLASSAAASPTADLVIVWAPGAKSASIEAVARGAGAVMLDRSPAADVRPNVAALVRRGLDAYDGLRLDEARATLDEASLEIDRTGAAGLTATQLSDLFLYRGLVRAQVGDPTSAWDELVTAVVVDPSRVLDPARFPPRVVAELQRAQAAVAERPRATLSVVTPPGCAVAVDGTPVAEPYSPRTSASSVAEVAGAHWVRVTCADHAPWGSRVDVTAPATTITAHPIAYEPPSDADVMIQARAASARAVIIVEVHGAIATARLIGAEGREHDRRTVAATPDLALVAEAVGQLLQPREGPRWYQSRWVWAAGAVAIAAAILIPITSVLAHDSRASSVNLKINPPPW
jgi:hypothetical protein